MEKTLYRETKWLRFYVVERKPKTVVMHVRNTSNQFLGSISWRGGWRQYTFNTDSGSALTFNDQCLKDIADVLTSLNAEHKKGKKRKVDA